MTKAPPIPITSLPISKARKEGFMDKRPPIEIRAKPTNPTILTPYLLVKIPPKTEMKMAGKATRNIRLLATVWLMSYSDMIEGNTGGIACIENKNEKAAKKATMSIVQCLFMQWFLA